MKITTSFSPPLYNLVPVLRIFFYSVAAISTVLMIFLIINGIKEQAKLADLRQHLTKVEKRAASKAAMPIKLPPLQQLRQVRQRVAEINQLSGGKGWPLPKILDSLEKLLPKSAYLISLQHKQQTGELYILAEAGKVSFLTKFLHRLEREKHFAEVLLVRQTQRGIHGKQRIQYELKIREQGYDTNRD